MIELIDTRPGIDVQETEYKRLLGYPAHYALEGRSRELADWARRWYAEHGKPWVYARRADDFEVVEERVRIDGTAFVSMPFLHQLAEAQAHSVVLVAVSAGTQCEAKARQLWEEERPDEYFFMEMYGSAVVEHLIASTGGRICDWAERSGLAVLPHYSPGYSGWEVSDQIKLWDLIRHKNERGFPGEIRVLDTGMLQPKKSLLAVFGITRRRDKLRSLSRLVPCENCSLPACQYRRAAYRLALPQVEDVRRLQSAAVEESWIAGSSPRRSETEYSINPRALQKWSRERLQLRVLQDRSVEARFRYEGTTCSNLGRPLEFDYHVRLGPPHEGYRITDAHCVPAPGDTGHTCMCEYLSRPEALMTSIATEKPLLGHPLDDVLSWERPYSPSGCYCDAERRIHKWGVVLEVIHYALAQSHATQSPPRQPPAIME